MDKEENTLGNLIVAIAATAQLEHNDKIVQKLKWHMYVNVVFKQILRSSF